MTLKDMRHTQRYAQLAPSRRNVLLGMAGGALATSVGSLATRPTHAATRGGHFNLGLGAGAVTDTLDPGLADQTFTQIQSFSYNNFLTEITSTGELIGELAENMEPTEGAAKWVFKLRKGVEFHNGRDVTAEDVIASLNHHRGADTKSAGKSIMAEVTDIRADGKDTVIVDLAAGNTDFPYMLAQYTFPIMPSNDGVMDWQSGIGCGAYKLKHFEPGQRSQFEKNANYWKTDRGWFDTVEIMTIADVVARTNALLTGAIDTMDRCDLKTVRFLEDDSAINVDNIIGTQHFVYPMRTDTAPFDDNNVRLALKYAIDRELFVQLILNGYGTPGNDHPISPANRFFASELPQRQYDPDKVKFHLKQAGLNELTVKLSVSDAAFIGAVDGASLYSETAAGTGANVKIEVERDPADGFWTNSWMKKPWTVSYWGGRPTEDWMFTLAYAKDSSWNETFWRNARFNELMVKARSETDDAKRREMYVEMQTLLSNEGGAVIPCFANYVFASRSDVGHGEIAGNWDMDGFRVVERWWKT